MNRLSGKNRLILAAVLLLLPLTASAWYPVYSYPGFFAEPYPGYYGVPYATGGWPGGSVYLRPRAYVHGYIDRFGNFRLDIKLRNISRYDLYQAWLWYLQSGYR